MQGKIFIDRKTVDAHFERLPLSLGLDILSVSTKTLLPWLSVQGFTDVCVQNLPLFAEQYRMEGVVQAQSLTNLDMDQCLTRQCQSELSFFTVGEQGRKEHLAACIQGTVLLAKERLPLQKFAGNASLDQTSVHLQGDMAKQAETFFTQAGFTLHSLKKSGEAVLSCELSSMATQESLTYPVLFDACVFATGFSLATDFGTSNTSSSFEKIYDRWSVSQIGFIVFGCKSKDEKFCLTVKRTLRQASLERYDIECATISGSILLSVTHFEWQEKNNQCR